MHTYTHRHANIDKHTHTRACTHNTSTAIPTFMPSFPNSHQSPHLHPNHTHTHTHAPPHPHTTHARTHTSKDTRAPPHPHTTHQCAAQHRRELENSGTFFGHCRCSRCSRRSPRNNKMVILAFRRGWPGP